MPNVNDQDHGIPRDREVIEVRVRELKQLFNAMDPSPFRERDLAPNAEEFIVGWATDLPRDAPLALRVHVDDAVRQPDDAAMLRDAVDGFFANRALSARRRLRALLRRGRMSLVIGLTFLAVLASLANLVAGWLAGTHVAAIASESLTIGGWVAMWRPLEVFLYDWWPIRAEIRLFDRLREMPVRIEYRLGGASEASGPATAAHRFDATTVGHAQDGTHSTL